MLGEKSEAIVIKTGVWQIKAIRLGTIYGDYSFNVAYTRIGEKIWVPCMGWYLTDGVHRVLFDTGFGDPNGPASLQTAFQVRREASLDAILAKEACSPKEIDIVVLSHLHWDHCADLDLFPDAELVVQWKELKFALDPPMIFAEAFNSPAIGRSPSWLNRRFTLLDGDKEILPGLRIISTPGHTVGHQSLLVHSKEKWIGLAADLFPLRANIDGDGKGHYFPNACINTLEWVLSAERFVAQCDQVVPSHDPQLKTEWIT